MTQEGDQAIRDREARNWFHQQQRRMKAELEEVRSIHSQPVAKGDGTEARWLKLLQTLPARYRAERAFVIDADGRRSQQIDIVIHDRQFCPCLLDTAGGIHIPAESVYAVLEVKQNLTKQHVEYAGEKIASVRSLRRTSAYFPHAAGRSRTGLKPIIGGLLTYESGWSPAFGARFLEVLAASTNEARLDIGCAIGDGGFEVVYTDEGIPQLTQSAAESSLIFFFLRLLHRLQQIATVPAIDYLEYGRLLVVGQDEAAEAAGLLSQPAGDTDRE